MDPKKIKWLLLSGGAAMAASFLTRNALAKGWNTATGEDPPLNPASAKTDWSEAVVWTVAVSVAAGLSQLMARRGVAAALDESVPDDLYD